MGTANQQVWLKLIVLQAFIAGALANRLRFLLKRVVGTMSMTICVPNGLFPANFGFVAWAQPQLERPLPYRARATVTCSAFAGCGGIVW